MDGLPRNPQFAGDLGAGVVRLDVQLQNSELLLGEQSRVELKQLADLFLALDLLLVTRSDVHLFLRLTLHSSAPYRHVTE